jgi:hypothetical protein
LKEGLEEIGNSAFSSTSLKSVLIPSSLKVIGLLSFSSCAKLTDVTLLANNLTSFGNNVIKDSPVKKVKVL